MPNKPKTGRHRATVPGATMAQELGVVRSTVIAHMHRLGIKPHYAFGRQVMFTPKQAEQITESINQIKASMPTAHLSQGGLTPDRTSILIDALSKGVPDVDLIRVHKATLKECDTIVAWWQRKQNEIVLSHEIVIALEKRVGHFVTGKDLVTLFEEAILSASTCHSCGNATSRICRDCAPLARANGKPVKPTTSDVVDDLTDPVNAKIEDLARRLLEPVDEPHNDETKPPRLGDLDVPQATKQDPQEGTPS